MPDCTAAMDRPTTMVVLKIPSDAKRPSSALGTWLAALLAVLGLCVPQPARGQESKATEVFGYVKQIEPTRLTLITGKGEEITFTTRQDYTGKIPMGSGVTVWYVEEDGGSVLEKLEASKPSVASPAAHGNLRRVVLLASSSVPDAGGLYDAITKYFQTRYHWYVAPRLLAEEVRRRATKSVSALDAMDSETGDFDMAKYLSNQEALVSRVAYETRVDMVLQLDVERVTAKTNRLVAKWDGVVEPIAGKNTVAIAQLNLAPERGSVPAATVVLKLFDAHGTLLWNNRRGLAVLGVREGLGGKLRYRSLPEYLADSARVARWIEETFVSFSPDRGGEGAAVETRRK